jgi:hypothetical protein
MLCAYIGNRELAIKQGEVYQSQLDDNICINFEPTIGKLKLSHVATMNDYQYNEIKLCIRDQVSRNDEVYLRKNGTSWDIFHKKSDMLMGQLTDVNKLDLTNKKKTLLNSLPGRPKISGFYVCDIQIYTYNECVEYDNKHFSSYNKNWCSLAKNGGKGFTFLVDIAGYGKIELI